MTRAEAILRLALVETLTLAALVAGLVSSWRRSPRLLLGVALILLLESIPYLTSGTAAFHWFAAGMFVMGVRQMEPLDQWSASGVRALGVVAGGAIVIFVALTIVSTRLGDFGNLLFLVLWLLMVSTLAFLAVAGLWPRRSQPGGPSR